MAYCNTCSNASGPFLSRAARVWPSRYHKVVDSVLMADVVQRPDMRMAQARNCPSLALEALVQLRIAGKICGKNLDGNDAVELRISGAMHLAHSAGADRGDDFVRAQSG